MRLTDSVASAAALPECGRLPTHPFACRQQGAPRRAPARLPGMAASPPPARCYARAPQKSFEASSGTGRSPPAFEEWLAAKPQDMLSEQCERSIEKSFAQDNLPPTGEGVWGAEYRSPKVGAPAPGAGATRPRGHLHGGAERPRARRPILRPTDSVASAAGLPACFPMRRPTSPSTR